MTFFGGEVKLSDHVIRFYSTLNIPRGMIEIFIGKIQRPFLVKFFPLCYSVSAASGAENCGG
jgi:hypothetical protein